MKCVLIRYIYFIRKALEFGVRIKVFNFLMCKILNNFQTVFHIVIFLTYPSLAQGIYYWILVQMLQDYKINLIQVPLSLKIIERMVWFLFLKKYYFYIYFLMYLHKFHHVKLRSIFVSELKFENENI